MTGTTPSTRRRHGGALLLTLIALGVALLAALSLRAAAARATSTSVVISDLVQARFASESALAAALGSIERSGSWASLPAAGEWITDMPVGSGSASVTAQWPDGFDQGDHAIANASFESGAGSLASPLLNPPMSGVLGGWDVARTALVKTGLTVPQIEIIATASATEGAQAARIRFGASVSGSATISRTLADGLAADSAYTCQVDIFTSGLPALNATFGFRIYAGGVLMATTEEALTLFDHLTPEQIQTSAQSLLQNAQEPATLMSAPLGAFTFAYTLTFSTPTDPPPGLITIELFAESLGVASHVGFDNVRLAHTSDSPLRLTSTGRCGASTHVISVLYGTDLAGGGRALEWSER